MASPYANPYGSLTKVDVKGPSADERKRAEEASGSADLLRLLSSAAPIAGTAIGTAIGAAAGAPAGGIGAIPGAAIGGAIGGGVGNLAGSALSSGADNQTREFEEKDLARRRRLEAIQRVAGML